MNLPNKLTLMRIILTPIMLAVLLLDIPHHFLYAVIIFSIASITDSMDGYLARKNNMITNFGKLMDPLADKMLVSAALIGLVYLKLCDPWILFIFIFREFAVTSLRMVATSEKGNVIAANNWGKAKTVSQIVAIILVLVFAWVKEIAGMNIVFKETDVLNMTVWFDVIALNVLWISAILTLISGVIYFWQHKNILKDLK